MNPIVIHMVVRVRLVFPMEMKKQLLKAGTPARQRLYGAGSVFTGSQKIAEIQIFLCKTNKWPMMIFAVGENGGKKNEYGKDD